MARQHFATLFVLLCLLFSSVNLVNAVPNSVCVDKGINSLRPCAITCIGCVGVPDQIAYWLGCGNDPANECWCSTGLYHIATSGLSSCISNSCTIGGWEDDYTNAVGFYTSYCQKAGFTAVAGPVDAPADPTPTQNPNTVVATNAIVVTETVVESTTVTGGTTTVVTDITITSVTGTRTTEIPTSVTQLVFSTYTTVLNDTSAAQLAAEWTGAQGSSKYEKVAIAVGVVCGVIIVALIAWIIYLRSRNAMLEAMLQNGPPMGGTQDYDRRPRPRYT
ncbi:hypothetical protein TWF730_008063 [Orbilia blumenaviensis]|uniref:Uncharacterized protein n=1 Tax=Orbilia blumenaviensis TaxID=1796055 RepID=A0AAV9V9Q6_9PEZI